MFSVSLLLLLFLNVFQYQVECAKILAVLPFPGKSQFICVEPYLKELAKRGHEVTVVSAHPQKQAVKNYRDVPVKELYEGYEEIIKSLVMESPGIYDMMNMESDFFIKFQTTVLDNPGFQQLMKTGQFDLVISEQMQTELLVGLGPHFNASMIGISSLSTIPMTDDLVGNTSPISYIVNTFSELESLNTIWDRFTNLKKTVISKLFHHYVHLAKERQLFKQYFPNVKTDIAQLRKNFSLVLVNDHFALSGARPYVPNMLEVGGFWISKEPETLPPHIEKFINESKHGVIYFSMGTNVRSSDFPVPLREAILSTFAALPERVLWKFEKPDLLGNPKNVLISSWFSQTAVLKHPNVKLFISHCGQLSTMEALYHAKPVLGFPALYDQFTNSKKLKTLKMGIIDTFENITVDKFTRLIRTVIDDPQYALNAKKRSAIYHDEPMTTLEKAIYWTEYVLRYQGAPQLQVRAQKLSFIEYFNIDIFLIILFALITSVLTVTGIAKYMMSKILITKQNIIKNKPSKKKRN